MARAVHANSDLAAAPASARHKFDRPGHRPLLDHTFSKIAVGIGDNLVSGAAQVCLKEHRKLILAARPALGDPPRADGKRFAWGDHPHGRPAVVIRPKSLDDLQLQFVGKILDQPPGWSTRCSG